MKNILLTILLVLVEMTIHAQTQAKIKFSYDAAGNQTNRVYCSDGVSCEGTGHKAIVDEAVIAEEIATEIEKTDVAIAENIQIFPNPTKGNITLIWEQGTSNSIATIVMSNSAGMGAQELPFRIGQKQITVDLSTKADGLYIIRFYLNSGDVITKKIIKH